MDTLTHKRKSLATMPATEYRKVRSLWSQSGKTDKSVAAGIVTAAFVVYLTPGVLCPNASPGCLAACFGSATEGSNSFRFSAIQQALERRTAWLMQDREGFEYTLVLEFKRRIAKLSRSLPQEKRNLLAALAEDAPKVSIRLNGTSDYRWSRDLRIRLSLVADYAGFEAVFYEYTKLAPEYWDDADMVHRCYSASELTPIDRIQALVAQGYKVSVPFAVARKQELPLHWHGMPVVDGDKHDAIWIHHGGCIIGLRAKGKGKSTVNASQGFIRSLD